MTKCTFTLLAPLFCSYFSFGQNALFTSAALLTGETRIDYAISTPQPDILETGTIQLAANPRFGFSFLTFTEREDFHQAGLYALHFNRYEDLLTSQSGSTGGQVTTGTKITAAGGGLNYRYGWRGGRAGENWLFHVSANAGAFYQNIQKTPKTSADFPVNAWIAGVEGGFRLHALRKFGETGFLSLSFPLLFLEMKQTWVKAGHPSFTSIEQQQSTFSQNFTTLDKVGIEFGGGFYLQQKKK
jgi:hypothetical protein